MDKNTLSCVDCGTQNCKFKTRTYPDFCLTTNLSDEDAQWAAVRYDEDRLFAKILRVTGHNPAAALYTSHSYYKKGFGV